MRPLGVEPIRGDLADDAALNAGMQGCEQVYHMAEAEVLATARVGLHAVIVRTRAICGAGDTVGDAKARRELGYEPVTMREQDSSELGSNAQSTAQGLHSTRCASA